MAERTASHAGTVDEATAHLVGGVSVDLLGQRGSGRTSLVSAVVDELAEQAWSSIRIRGIAALQDRPLEALGIAGLARVPDRRGESAVAAATHGMVDAMRSGRAVLVVDDVDDLDQVSAGVIVAAHAQHAFPVLTTSRPRPGPDGGTTALLTQILPAVRLVVAPLTFVEVHAMVADLLPGPIDPELAARVNAASGGLPGLVSAIVRSGRAGGQIRLVEGAWRAGPDLWSQRLERALGPLVADADPPVREALQVLALAGPVTVGTAVDLVGWDALEDLDAAQLLRVVPGASGDLVAIYPPVLADERRQLAPGIRRRRLLQRTSRAGRPAGHPSGASLDDADAPAPPPWFRPEQPTGEGRGPTTLTDSVVNRLMRDDWQRRYLACRRDWLRERTPRTAVPYLRTLLVGAADAAAMRDVISRTAPPSDPTETAELLRWHALVLAYAEDDVPAAHALLREGASLGGARSEELQALDDHLTLGFERLPPRRETATTPADPSTRQFAECVEAERLIAAGEIRSARAILDDASWTDRDLLTTRDVLVGVARLLDGELESARTWAAEHLESALATLDPDPVPGHAYVAANALALQARTGELRRLLGSVLATGLTSSPQRQYSAALLDLTSVVARGEGLSITAASLRSQARYTATRPGTASLPTAAWALDPAAGTSEPPDRLWAGVTELVDRGLLVSAVMLGGHVVDLDPDVGRARFLRTLVGDGGPGLLDVVVRVCEAAVAAHDDAGAELGRQLVRDGHVALGVRATMSSVRRLRDAGRAVEATPLVLEMRETLVRDGLEPELLLGSSLATSALTAREHEIATLVARGMTNSEIARRLDITGKTVENHVYRSMLKLGATERGQIAGLLGVRPSSQRDAPAGA